jgi:thioredoxin-related protein
MKYSKIIVVVALLLFQLSIAQEKADVVLNKAFTEAKTEKKNVLLVFHASWCKWCKMMEKNMDLPETQPIFNKRFVTAYIDVQERGEKKSLENPGGQELMNKYKGENAGLPFWLVLNQKEKSLLILLMIRDKTLVHRRPRKKSPLLLPNWANLQN